jgi:WhiB family transcriptional regulator, redox-sensing transcriptional regulator
VAVSARDWRRLCDDIADVTSPPSWHEWAACRGQPLSTFFPESTTAQASAPAVRICSRCPVRVECRAAGALEPDGVWGGIRQSRKPRHRATVTAG